MSGRKRLVASCERQAAARAERSFEVSELEKTKKPTPGGLR